MLRTVRRGAVPLLCCLTAALLAAQSASADPVAPASATPAASSQAKLWATQLQFDNNGTPWTEAFFASIKAAGVNEAELNMPWGSLEPAQGTFDFTELDQELANAAAAGLRLVPIFWQSGWQGSPAPWITGFEQSSTGGVGTTPAWWDLGEQQAYFQYVTTTVAHIARNRGYGGAILNYGYLDAQWDIPGNGDGGWAPADVAYFQDTWLPETYRTIAKFNAEYGTDYTSFSQVPAATSGTVGTVYQQFRIWSVQDTYQKLTEEVRKVTGGPLYYYFGGHIANSPTEGNLPDVFFSLARRYDLTIIEDAAASPGLSLLFGSLGRAYHVKVAQEWTPTTVDLYPSEAVQWMANYALTAPFGGGEDFFIHDGTSKDVVGYPMYTGWLPTLKSISGSYPTQPVAVYIDESQALGNASGGSLTNVENDITSLWDGYQAGFAVVTSTELANHADSLAHYQAVLPLNGVDANLTAYQKNGGTLLTSGSQLAQYAPAYAQLSSSHVLQVSPATAADHRSSTLTLGEVSPYFNYDGAVELSPAGLDLRKGTYHVVDVTNKTVPAQTTLSDGDICAPVDMASATLDQWNVEPGPAPAGTPVAANCSLAASGPTTVSGTAAQAGGSGVGDGLVFLDVGATGTGADGNLTQVTQDGQAAYETWTSAQTGVGSANVYLQLDPTSQVYTASTVTLAVTYWSVAGQGFQPQYDTATAAYQAGPTVAGSGTGSWQTATVTLTGAQFAEEQNLSADLRLAATNTDQPLIVSSVTLSTGD
jgi:Beta-galactosidase